MYKLTSNKYLDFLNRIYDNFFLTNVWKIVPQSGTDTFNYVFKMRISGLVPARFLTIIAHLVIVIVIFWSKVSEYNFEVFFNYLPHTMAH